MGNDGKLKVNKAQAKIVKRIYEEYLDGKTVDYIKRSLIRDGIKNWDGKVRWEGSTIKSMLGNEKYKGDALLQKSYTTDFLNKKRVKNKGDVQMYYIEEDHEPIIDKKIWECVQLERERRAAFLKKHCIKNYSANTETTPFSSKIICGTCNKAFVRKGWTSSTGEIRKVWQCNERYRVKGVQDCTNRHIEEVTLVKAFLLAWNTLLENRDACLKKWQRQMEEDNLLEAYRAERFIEYTSQGELMTELDIDFMLKILDHIKVFENRMLIVVFMNGTEIELE